MVGTPLQQQSLPATDRVRTIRRTWRAKAALALAFWTGLGLRFSVQGSLLWPDQVTPLRAMQMTMPRWYVWGLLAPLTFAADHRGFGHLPLSKRILAHIPLGI